MVNGWSFLMLLTQIICVDVIKLSGEDALGWLERVVRGHVHLKVVGAAFVESSLGAFNPHEEEAYVFLRLHHVDSLH